MDEQQSMTSPQASSESWDNPFLEKIQTFQDENGCAPTADDLWHIYCALTEKERLRLFKRMFFLRHGETVANEQNYFAGRHETNLSELGFEQARKGGKNMALRNLVFDEVHISPLMRTYETAITILEQLKQKNVRVYVSDQIVERDFGFYSHFNKNLMCKAAGYKAYEESLHSITGFPPGGETFMEMYRRTLNYFRESLLPRVAEGKIVLVVCHKYIVEMFGMILAGKDVDKYHDMRLPNAHAMSGTELRAFAMADSKMQKELADRTIFFGPLLFFLATIAGAGLKLLLPEVQIPKIALLLSLGGLLAISSFFVMLSIHTGIVLSTVKAPGDIFSKKYIPWFLRVGLVMAAVFILDDKTRECIWLLVAMPPALTAPVLSILWGGNLYMAIRVTVLLSCLLPLVMPILFIGIGFTNLGVLIPFVLTLVFSIFLPTGLAQRYRAQNPIRAGKTLTRWKWLSVVAVALICFLGTFYFTPATLLSMSYDRLFAFEKQGLAVLGVFVLMKGFAFYNLLYTKGEAPDRTDLYITQSTPNIFLWLSIISMLPDAGLLGFWGCLCFTLSILFDEWYFVHTFRINLQQELCRQAENFWQYKRYRRREPRLATIAPGIEEEKTTDADDDPFAAATATPAATVMTDRLPAAPPPEEVLMGIPQTKSPWVRMLTIGGGLAVVFMAVYFALQPTPPPPPPAAQQQATASSVPQPSPTPQKVDQGVSSPRKPAISEAPLPPPVAAEPAPPQQVALENAAPTPVPVEQPVENIPAAAASPQLPDATSVPVGPDVQSPQNQEAETQGPTANETSPPPAIATEIAAPQVVIENASANPVPAVQPKEPPSTVGSQQQTAPTPQPVVIEEPSPPVAVAAPEISSPPAPPVAVVPAQIPVEDEIKAFLSSWSAAWEKAAGQSGDVTAYLDHYSDSFNVGKFDKAGWQRDKTPKLKNSEWVKIGIDSIKVQDLDPGKTIEVRFAQTFQSPRLRDNSKKILVVRKETTGWRIVSEKTE